MQTMQKKKKYFIGDVHGCFKTLMALLDKLPNKGIGLDITFVGDVIDRGADSIKIIELIMERGYTLIRGNHEDMMIDCWNNMGCEGWLGNGGDELAEEFDDMNTWDPERYSKIRKFIFGLPLYLVLENEEDEEDFKFNNRKILVTHAPSIDFFPEEKTKNLGTGEMEYQLGRYEETIIWNRNFPRYTSDVYFNIVGHNPSHLFKEKYPSLFDENDLVLQESFASIDTSCCYGGKLTCLVLPQNGDANDLEVIQQDSQEVFKRKVRQTRGYMG